MMIAGPLLIGLVLGAGLLLGVVVWGFSQIFRIHAGVRALWAAVIFLALGTALILGAQKAVHDAKIPMRTEAESRQDFLEDYFARNPDVDRSKFN